MDGNIDKNIEEPVEKNNKNKKLIIAIIALIVLLIGGTYAWYIITVQGTKENVIKAGKLSLVLDESESVAIDLSNSVPMTDSQGLDTKAYTFKLKNNGDIASSYTIYLDDIALETGETRMLDKYVKYSLTKDNGEAVTALLPTTGTNPNRILDSGIIEDDTTHVYTLRLWIDKDADNAVMNTTFRGKLRVEAAQTNIVADSKIICKRATQDTLHKETCSQTSTSSYCGADGYATGDIITYGSTGTSGSLTTGDAFDCDVDGTGIYDDVAERFYYITDMDSDTAVLVYYNNVSGGVASNSTSYAYDESGSNNNGPATAKLQLPSTTQWSNVSLTSTTRAITNESDGTTTEAGNLPTAFSYEGYAARLLTYQEVEKGCYDETTGITYIGGLSSKCKFLLENTKYSNSSLKLGFWLETPDSSTSNRAWNADGADRSVVNTRVTDVSSLGVRPAIEVLKSNILY